MENLKVACEIKHAYSSFIQETIYWKLSQIFRYGRRIQNTRHTNTYQHHQIFRIGYYERYSYDDALSKYRSHRDLDCISWFIKQLEELAHRVKTLLSINIPKDALSREQWEAYRNATHCHICEKPFAPDDTRIRDHCHLIGRYRGPAHSNCNLNYKDSFYIPIVLYSYSFPQFIRLQFTFYHQGNCYRIWRQNWRIDQQLKKNTFHSQNMLKISPKNQILEIVFKLRFIDSYKFLSFSLINWYRFLI